MYHESMAISGLHFISLSIGYALGTQIIAPLNDRVYRRFKARNNGVGRPEVSFISRMEEMKEILITIVSMSCYDTRFSACGCRLVLGMSKPHPLIVC